jgi:ubiquinone/menaquinone biosynthesis C-methylase UbiE
VIYILNIKDWHDRFTTQLKWTLPLRDIIYSELNISPSTKIFEPGCGTGALLLELGTKFHCDLYGCDIDSARLNLAKETLDSKGISVSLTERNALKTLYPPNFFDYIFTHYLFLWIENLSKVFSEFHRILKPNGKLIILAEPDYGGVIEEPNTNLKNAIQINLKKQGANPNICRFLPKYWIGKFKIMNQFSSSIPWLASDKKRELLEEIRFLSSILEGENVNFFTLQSAVVNDEYFLYVPVFTFILEKIQPKKK